MEKTGHLHIRLGELLEENGLSKNKFSQRAEMQRTQLNKYINDEVALLSVDVLERICSVLDCQISDLRRIFGTTRILSMTRMLE